ncbi:hypothetical protein NLU13_0666 [Sarocladium strictum]|uniref:SH3 domain-containing protein n=1 Tax=Sarocladium strictum TaxID=5046 RepID=A0AA39GPH3_SARSR|nr:hypothetical protein NLU13_0666 [Sarocladium strictum]
MATNMDDIGHLVITPFQEVVEKGKTAVENAGDSQPMAKAALSLVKEGERALKKIEPLCKKYVAEFGVNFRDALRENDEIAEYRTMLNDLLWEFDDFIDDADCFDAEKFAELQAASRKAAPKIYDILMRMKLEAPYDDLSPVGSLPHSIGTQQSYASRPSTAFLTHMDQHQQPASPAPAIEPRPDSGIYTIEDATSQLKRLMAFEDGFEERPAPLQPSPQRQPPAIPSTNPWDVNVMPPVDETRSMSDAGFERRPEVSRDGAESPIDPSISPVPGPPDAQRRQVVTPVQQEPANHVGNESAMSEDDDRNYLPSSGSQPSSPGRERRYSPFPPPSARPRTVAKISQLATSIPEDSVINGTGGLSISQPPASAASSQEPNSPEHTGHGIGYAVSSNFAGFEQTYRPTIISHHTQGSTSETVASPQISPRIRPVQDDSEGLQVAPSHNRLDQEMLIPVDADLKEERTSSSPLPLAGDCSITPQSSFWLAKGFCDGAKEVSRGGIGIKKTKKPVGFTTSATVARCTSCMCELDFKDIENDVNKLESGTFSRGSISYRIRFLQKSHIAAKRVDDVQYGCLFCLQQGHTLDESDATVFFSPRALMDHIARHPRPLPDVPGVVTIDGPEVPPNLANDFDIHLKKPSVPHPVIEVRSEIISLPSGMTKEPARRLFGQRLLFDRTPALELAQGARITGLTWPARYNGEWAYGWHDGVYATVPTDLLKLDTPPSQHVKLGGTSMIRARARWRFNPGKDKGSDWLKFDKNDVIKNITWSYFDHWCWSGTNAKGKWGIFPQAFIDTNTLEEPMGLNRAISLSDEKNRSTSLIARFSRRQSGSHNSSPQQGMRPPSVAGSTSSHESRGMQPHMGRGSCGDVHAS